MINSRAIPLQIIKSIKEPFDSDEWLFEIKHDGFRVVASRQGGRTTLLTHNGNDISRGHRHIIRRLNALPALHFVMDGELVVLDDDGRSNFPKLMFGRTGTHYYAFDLLMLDSIDMRQLPLVTRKQALRQLIEDRDTLRYCDHVAGYGRSFFELVRNAGLEGMVAKRRQSIYSGALTTDWLKVKCLRKHDFVVGGWLPDHSGRGAGALLLGEYFGEVLHYVGAVRNGFDRRRLRETVLGLSPRKLSPFIDPIDEPDALFCDPSLRVPIEFVEFTDYGHLRRPALSRFEYMSSTRRPA